MQDLPRTFPGHPWLDTKEGHAALRRVLVGYSFRDSDVGYCQVCLVSVMKTRGRSSAYDLLLHLYTIIYQKKRFFFEYLMKLSPTFRGKGMSYILFWPLRTIVLNKLAQLI